MATKSKTIDGCSLNFEMPNITKSKTMNILATGKNIASNIDKYV